MSTNLVLIDSRDRSSGTAWQYAVNLTFELTPVASVRLRWIRFFDSATKAPVDVFRDTPFISLKIDQFQGTHRFSTSTSTRNAVAIIRRDFDPNTYLFQSGTGIQLEQFAVSLDVSLLDHAGNPLQLPGIEHAFMMEVTLL